MGSVDEAGDVENVGVEESVSPCFLCGRPAVGLTSILMGTREGVPRQERDVLVCEDCYALLKEKVRTRSRLTD